MFQVNLLHNLV